MARRVESRFGVPGVRVLNADTGARQLLAGTRIVTDQLADSAFGQLAGERQRQAVTYARQATLTRDERGNLVSAQPLSQRPYPSIYSVTYDEVMQKRFLNEVGLEAAEKLAEYHNLFKLDPEGFRNAADAYTEEVLENVSDPAYEAARGVLQTLASQHFTDIADKRARRDFEDGQAVTAEVLTRLVFDMHANAASDVKDESARLDMHTQLLAQLEGELMFASADDIAQLSIDDANQVRDQAIRMTAIGEIQRNARHVFAQAEDPEDVAVLMREASANARKSLSPELTVLMGGEEAALDLIEKSIALTGYERAVGLASRDMRQRHQFNHTVREVQAQQAYAITHGDYDEYAATLMQQDPASLHDPALRGSIVQMLATGKALEHGRTQDTAVLEALKITAERAGAELPGQLAALAKRFHVPWNAEQSESAWPLETYLSPGTMEDAIVKMRAMLSSVEQDTAGGGRSADQEFVADHWSTLKAIEAGVIDRREIDLEDLQRRIGKGDAEANIELQNIHAEVRNAVRPHKYSAGGRRAMDEMYMMPILAQGLGVDPASMAHNTTHAFEMAMQADQVIAAQGLSYFEQMGGLSESAMRFLHTTGVTIEQGAEPIPEATLGAAMMAYDVLRKNPMARENADLPPSVEAGFRRLYDAGFRGRFGEETFALSGGSLPGAQQAYAGPSTTAEKERLIALGIDPAEGSSAAIAKLVKDQMGGWWHRTVAYPDHLSAQAQLYVEQQVRQTGRAPEAIIKGLRDSNFEALGYNRTGIVAAAWQSPDTSWLVQSAPGSLYINENMRRNPERYERIAQQLLATEFSHIPGLAGRTADIRLTGIEKQSWSYTDPQNIVKDEAYTALAYVTDSNGIVTMLTDQNGNPSFIDLNGVMKRAWQESVLLDDTGAKAMERYFRELAP